MKKVLCFGELLLRMSPGDEWLSEHTMPVFLGGAELNVATALSKWRVPVRYFTALPNHSLSKQIVSHLANKGIDTSTMHVSGNRIGVYFLQQGTDLQNGGVIYDRAHSSFYSLKSGDIDWEKVLDGVSWFHFSAISPALNESVAEVCKEGLKIASSKKITISVDLNYRAKLWQYGKKPADVMPSLVKYCDVIMGNLWAADTMLEVPVAANIHEDPSREAYLSHASNTSREIIRRFPKCSIVACTFRFDHNKGINYFSSIYNKENIFASPHFISESIVEKSGSGDCFMAGLIYGMQNELALQETIDFAGAAAFGKLHERGDATHNEIEDVKKILQRHG